MAASIIAPDCPTDWPQTRSTNNCSCTRWESCQDTFAISLAGTAALQTDSRAFPSARLGRTLMMGTRRYCRKHLPATHKVTQISRDQNVTQMGPISYVYLLLQMDCNHLCMRLMAGLPIMSGTSRSRHKIQPNGVELSVAEAG